jgi:hypothetical protein
MENELTMCRHCRYWLPDRSGEGEIRVASVGLCVRHAPRPQRAFLGNVSTFWKWAFLDSPGADRHNFHAVWPITKARHQCGEGERRKKEVR